MKSFFTRCRGSYAMLSLTGLLALCSLQKANATIPEPDHVVFGRVALLGQAVTAASTDVIIEARRTTNGLPVATYRMGDNPQAGDFYSLRIPIEAFKPVTSTSASTPGTSLFLVVRDSSGDLEFRPLTVGPRGTLTRLDIGNATDDSDNDGLPDAWELAAFGNLNQGPQGDADRDGVSNALEQLAGTDPANPNDALRLTIDLASGSNLSTVSFFARVAAGPGYQGFSRHYALEYSTNLNNSLWNDLPNYSDIVGNNSTVRYQSLVTPANAPRFFRARVWLTKP